MARISLVVVLVALLAACTGPSPREQTGERQAAVAVLPEDLHHRRVVVFPLEPPILTRPGDDPAAAARAAAALDPEALAKRRPARQIRADAVPLLAFSPLGRRYLGMQPPKALARGAPAESCPALVAAAAPTGSDRAAAARAALAGCAAALGERRAGCSCQLLALDDAVLVPLEALAYATGVTARLRLPDDGHDLVLVAEETPDGGAILRAADGPVARLDRAAGGRVTLTLLDGGRRFEGVSIPVGYRRGRLAERIYARDPEGRRLALLIGFDPAELARGAAAWLAWPRSGIAIVDGAPPPSLSTGMQ